MVSIQVSNRRYFCDGLVSQKRNRRWHRKVCYIRTGFRLCTEAYLVQPTLLSDAAEHHRKLYPATVCCCSGGERVEHYRAALLSKYEWGR